MVRIKELSINATIKLFGHKICGLAALNAAVEKSLYMGSSIDVYPREPKEKIAGLHVVEIWHPYPRFDSFDDCDNRSYSNYLVSDKEISDNDIKGFANGAHRIDYNLVNDEMNPRYAPAIYYV